jgi:hypothetical protein
MGVFGSGGGRSRWRRCSLSVRLASCIVSRIALADVSGHGQAVAVFGERLRELMQRYLLDLNHVVRAELGGGQYVTMVAVGFHGRRGLAVMTNAGHPPPLGIVPRVANGAGSKRIATASERNPSVCHLTCSTTLVKGRFSFLPIDMALWAYALWIATERTVKHIFRASLNTAFGAASPDNLLESVAANPTPISQSPPAKNAPPPNPTRASIFRCSPQASPGRPAVGHKAEPGCCGR